MKSREAISVTHCLLILSAVCFELRRHHKNWAPPSLYSSSSSENLANERNYGGQVDFIEASPRFTNTIIAFECGYLIQDFAILLLGSRIRARGSRERSVMARNINWRVLGWHHLGVAAALGLFHLKALRGQAKGSLVVLMMLLMNAS